MLNLYWHKWITSRGVCYLLHRTPWAGDTSRRLTGEVALVHRIAGRWQGKWTAVALNGDAQSGHVVTGGAAATRRAIESVLDRRSIGLFEVDTISFEAA